VFASLPPVVFVTEVVIGIGILLAILVGQVFRDGRIETGIERQQIRLQRARWRSSTTPSILRSKIPNPQDECDRNAMRECARTLNSGTCSIDICSAGVGVLTGFDL
jgi:hypothetical protein